MKKTERKKIQAVFSSYRIHSVIPVIFFRSESLITGEKAEFFFILKIFGIMINIS